jgi:hypothetical protein
LNTNNLIPVAETAIDTATPPEIKPQAIPRATVGREVFVQLSGSQLKEIEIFDSQGNTCAAFRGIQEERLPLIFCQPGSYLIKVKAGQLEGDREPGSTTQNITIWPKL